MWMYGIALVVECTLMGELFRRYLHRRKARIKSDRLKLAEEFYKTEKFKADLTDIRHQRDLVAELRELLK